MADGSGHLGGEACDALCYDPHLQTTSRSFPGPSQLLTRQQHAVCNARVSAFDLVQRSHRHFGDIVGDELPGGTLGIAGGQALAVPQVPCRHAEWLRELLTDGSAEKGWWLLLLLLTVFIHSKDRSPAHRELSERLSRGGRDVVPALSCRATESAQ